MHIYSWKGLHTSLWLSTTDTNTRLLFIKKNILSVYYCQYCNAGNVKHIIMAVFNMWTQSQTTIFCGGGSTKKFQFWSLQHGWRPRASFASICILNEKPHLLCQLLHPVAVNVGEEQLHLAAEKVDSCSRSEQSKVGNWDKRQHNTIDNLMTMTVTIFFCGSALRTSRAD